MYRKTLSIIIFALLITAPSFALQYGDQAPNFTLTDTQGNIHTLSEYQGRVVYLNFFGYA